MKQYEYYVYILASKSGTLYIGVTNDLMRRIIEHKAGKIPGFTKKYGCTKLVYFEDTDDVVSAIEREKQLKRWRREKKENLIRTINPGWNDLSEGWYDEWSEAPDYFSASYHSDRLPLSCHSEPIRQAQGRLRRGITLLCHSESNGSILKKERQKGSLRSGRDDKDSAIPGSFFPVIPSERSESRNHSKRTMQEISPFALLRNTRSR